MNDISLIEKISILMEIISSSTLFLISFIVCTIILAFFIICIALNKKINKWIFGSVGILMCIMLLINYGDIIIKIFDIIIDSAFMALYFPSLPVYMTIIIVSNIFLIISLFNKKMIKSQKIVNLINGLTLDFLLIIIIEIVRNNNIDIYEQVTLYSDRNLLVLLELSTGIFASWILINLIISAKQKLKKYDENESSEKKEIIFE